MSLLAHVVLLERQLFSRSDQDLLVDQVHTRCQLCDRMFHLKAGIDFEEIKILIFIEEEFDCSRVVIAGNLHDLSGCLSHEYSELGCQRLRWSFFHNLLMPALDRAFPFEKVYDISVVVGKHLKFDMPWLLDVFLQVNRLISKGRLGFSHARFKGGFQILQVADDPHSFSSASSGCFDHHRKSDLFGFGLALGQVLGNPLHPGDDRHPGFLHCPPGTDLISDKTQCFGIGSDEDDVFFLAEPGKVCVFCQESVARMDGSSACRLGCLNDSFHIKVTLHSRSRTDAERLIRHLNVKTLPVRF